MSARWAKGIWLGKRFSSEEHLIGLADGSVVRSGAVKPHPEVEWDSGLFDGIKGAPWDPLGDGVRAEYARAGVRDGDLPSVVVPRGAEDPVPPVRSMPITHAMCLRYGYTLGCRKCDALQSGDYSQPSLGHNPVCRARMEAKVADDPEEAFRLDRARGRREEYIARRGRCAIGSIGETSSCG